MSGEGADGGLMVWGYACKLFRDDEKAIHVDSGKHLIPWMGDDKLMIDRYDGRGALYDLTSHEAVDGSWDNLIPEEREVEMTCDSERYRALYEEEETITFNEEEEKKMHGKYGQVAYSYDDTGSVATCEPPVDIKSKAFTPPPGLELPQELVQPETMKQHAIIIKTAAFIAQQGSQMEILMRLKQQGNQKFNFLTHGDTLHEYYKFLLNCIKTERYVPSDADTSCLDEEETEGDHYLHPSLITSSTPPDPKNPPPLTQVIISKMVKYISKNGLIFEEAVRKLVDPRFSFLESSDIYYNFYREKVMSTFKIEEPIDCTPEETASEKQDSPPLEERSENETNSKKGTKRKPTPVCFSLKKPKDSESLEVSTALPQEDSSDDDEHENRTSPVEIDPPPPPPPPRISKTKLSRQDKDKAPSDNIQKERKAKVAQFLKGLKYK